MDAFASYNCTLKKMKLCIYFDVNLFYYFAIIVKIIERIFFLTIEVKLIFFNKDANTNRVNYT